MTSTTWCRTLVLIALAACKRDGSPNDAALREADPGAGTAGRTAVETGPAASPVSVESATYAPALGVNVTSLTKTPSGLYYRDLAPGSGKPVGAGQEVAVRYSGWLPDGTRFDANAAPDDPFRFTVGQGQVIPGWDEGLVGMKPGGKRQLVIPPSLGYGAQGTGPIPPNSILVFTVELVNGAAH